MQIDSTAAQSSNKTQTGPEIPIEAELLDKDGSTIGPIEASKRASDETLEDLHSKPEAQTNSKNKETGSKAQTSKIKKILIGVGIAIVALLGLKFLLGRKK